MNDNTSKRRFPLTSLLLIGFLISLSAFFHYRSSHKGPVIDMQKLKYCLEKGHVREVVLIKNQEYVKVFIHKEAFQKDAHQKLFEHARGVYNPKKVYYTIKIASKEIFDRKWNAIQCSINPSLVMDYIAEEESDLFGELTGWSNFLILMMITFLLLRFFSQGFVNNAGSGSIFGIGKSKAILWGKERKINTTLEDVAGMEEEKEEVKEIIDCLKDPERIKSLGGRIPKGLLLTGEPGVGKTLFAKAIAGESGVPFFSVSGSDFVELFVGVGSSRVDDLFEEARKNAPCVIFIDEIDAIGAARNTSKIGGSNEERENTLNKLLTEMDGFGTDDSIVVIGATNRPDLLDSALLRPGRFDLKVQIEKPTINDRKAIFKYHIKKAGLKVVRNLSSDQLALQTPGFTGADINNTCNQAAILAAREGKKQITMRHFQEAMDRVTIGLEKKTKVIPPKQKLIIAWHEAGHAVASWFLEHASPLLKVSIIPRGPSALGYAQSMPKEQLVYQTPELYDEVCALLAARAAEELTFGEVSTGAIDDLKRATMIAYNIVKKFGMDKTIGHLSFNDDQNYYVTPLYSQATHEKIDLAVQKIIKKEYQRAKNILKARKEELKIIAESLLNKEILLKKDLETLIGKRPFEETIEEQTTKTKLIGPAKK